MVSHETQNLHQNKQENKTSRTKTQNSFFIAQTVKLQQHLS